MQAVRTSFIGPGHHHGAMMRASCTQGYTRVPYDHALDEVGNHKAALVALLNKLGWTPGWGYRQPWYGGEHGGDWFWVYKQDTSSVQL